MIVATGNIAHFSILESFNLFRPALLIQVSMSLKFRMAQTAITSTAESEKLAISGQDGGMDTSILDFLDFMIELDEQGATIQISLVVCPLSIAFVVAELTFVGVAPHVQFPVFGDTACVVMLVGFAAADLCHLKAGVDEGLYQGGRLDRLLVLVGIAETKLLILVVAPAVDLSGYCYCAYIIESAGELPHLYIFECLDSHNFLLLLRMPREHCLPARVQKVACIDEKRDAEPSFNAFEDSLRLNLAKNVCVTIPPKLSMNIISCAISNSRGVQA